MSPQLVLTIIGAVNVLMGIAIYVGAESIVTGGAFSSYLINDASIKVGVYMHEAVASFMIAFGFVALLCRDLENNSARKLLFAIGISYVVNLTSVLLHTMNPEVHPPIPAVIITLALAGLSFYTANASD
tara:strand:- start:961 stop:1347 length:387 start_codon:yes stop_codon:yes gene_type:complete